MLPFKKKTESEISSITFYNTTTKKQEVEFYNHMLHLEKSGFGWEDASLEFRYSVRLSTNKKKTNKKNKHGKNNKKTISWWIESMEFCRR